jgi:tetratricopeptide (TPR) repeat protein
VCNRSCWLELSELCLTEKLPPPTWQQLDPRLLSAQTVNQQFPSSSSKNNNGGNNRKGSGQEGRVMYLCFLAHYYLELQQGEKAMKVLEGVLHIFPNSQIATSQVALSHYCMRDYEKAQNVFEQARERDPHRIEHLDAYSNILYVRERRAELSYLAHRLDLKYSIPFYFNHVRYLILILSLNPILNPLSLSAMRLAPLTPETCCVVGNYYSLKGKHERAILYFQRALKLNPKCLSAWTLMGHECVELRNTAAAVQCYRKAVDVSSGGDYRAWYGLGQTYEMLHMYQYALYYYKSAAALRPSDGRMWCAVGNCLCRLGTKAEATKAFERAVAAGDREGVATRELARLYRDGGLAGKAAECYYHHLLLTGGEELITAVQRVVQGIASVPIGSAAPSSLYGMSSGDGSGGHMDELISGADEVVDAERAEALLYLAGYYKGQGMMAQAELLCSR